MSLKPLPMVSLAVGGIGIMKMADPIELSSDAPWRIATLEV